MLYFDEGTMRFSLLMPGLPALFLTAACQSTGLQSSGAQPNANKSFSALAGSRIRVEHFRHTNPDCSNVGFGQPKVTAPPRGGTVEFKRETDFPNFAAGVSTAHCNTRRVHGLAIYYRANPNFVGTDSFSVDFYWVDGDKWSRNFTVQVAK